MDKLKSIYKNISSNIAWVCDSYRHRRTRQYGAWQVGRSRASSRGAAALSETWRSVRTTRRSHQALSFPRCKCDPNPRLRKLIEWSVENCYVPELTNE